MSQFLDYGFQFTKEKPICASWSNSEGQPLLAISTTSPRIIFLQEEVILEEYQITKGKQALALKWHPTSSCLGIGWADGSVGLWAEENKSMKEDKSTHKSAITCIVFNSDGSRMVTGDKVIMWVLCFLEWKCWSLENDSRPFPDMSISKRRGNFTYTFLWDVV